VSVRVAGLRKNYGNLVALDGVSFEAAKGRVFAYLGPNGAGKTTTINILCGLLERDGGEVSILGRDVACDPVFVKSRIGVVTENSNLYPELRCQRNLEYMGELYGLSGSERRSRAEELLNGFGLADRATAPFGTLSRGMKRRLTVAAALVHRPEVLFLDEPTTGLDVPSARSLRGLIRRIVADGTTVFLTTHNLFEAEELADEVTVLVAGRTVAGGSVAEIKQRVGGARSVAVRFSGAVHEDALTSACPAVRSAKLQDGSWRLDVSDLHEALGQLVAFCQQEGLRVEEVGTREPTLEDAFVSLLAGPAQPDRRDRT
jgi:ABC-2 type transport system ATP-binding protein